MDIRKDRSFVTWLILLMSAWLMVPIDISPPPNFFLWLIVYWTKTLLTLSKRLLMSLMRLCYNEHDKESSVVLVCFIQLMVPIFRWVEWSKRNFNIYSSFMYFCSFAVVIIYFFKCRKTSWISYMSIYYLLLNVLY